MHGGEVGSVYPHFMNCVLQNYIIKKIILGWKYSYFRNRVLLNVNVLRYGMF